MTFGSGFMSAGNFIRAAHFLPNSGPYHSQPKKKLATTAARIASQFRWNCGCMAPPRKRSARLLPLRLEHGAGGRRGEELDQRLCRGLVLRAHADAGMEDGVVLQLGRQRPQDFDAGGAHELVEEDDAELDFPRRDELADFDARGGGNDFPFHPFGDPDALEQAREVDSALAFFRPGDGIRVEERAPERLLRADVRTRRALPDSDSHARARDRGAPARLHPALLREVVEPGGGEYREVEGFAAFDLALQGGGEAEGDDELVSSRALEGGRELVQRLLDSVRGEDLDFGGGDGSRGQHGCYRGKRFEVHFISLRFRAGRARRRSGHRSACARLPSTCRR